MERSKKVYLIFFTGGTGKGVFSLDNTHSGLKEKEGFSEDS